MNELGQILLKTCSWSLTVVGVVVGATEAACCSKDLSLSSSLILSLCSFISWRLSSDTDVLLGLLELFWLFWLLLELDWSCLFWYISFPPLDGAVAASDSALSISDVFSRLVTIVLLDVFEINLFFLSLGLVVSSEDPVWPPEFGEVNPCWDRL